MASVDNVSSLAHFLTTGQLGPLKRGLGIKEVYDLLGDPDDVFHPYPADYHLYADREPPNLVVLSYNNLDITFLDDQVVMMTIDFEQDNGELPEEINVEWYDDVKKMDVDAFIQYLRKKGIRCQRIVHELIEPNILLWLDQTDIQIQAYVEDEYRIKKIILGTGGVVNWPALEDCW